MFLDRYTEALVVSAAMEFFGMESKEDKPTKHLHDHDSTMTEPEAHVKDTLGLFVDTYALPSERDLTSSSTLVCPVCTTSFATTKSLKDHIKTKHNPGDDDKDSHDAVYAYSCGALSMCMVAYEFTNARQLGDGERIIRLMKYMLLYFRSAGKVKYAYQVLRQLAQAKCFLSPREAHNLVWNRFANIKGKEDTNVELDRVIEHINLLVKNNCRGLHGQVKQKTIDRLSRSCQHMHTAISRQDKATDIHGASKKRRVVDQSEDVMTLAQHLHQEQIFRVDEAGRYHKAFPAFTRGYIMTVDHRQLHSWMKTTLDTLSRKYMFKPPGQWKQ